MSTLTLAVDDYFRPDLSAKADVGGPVAGSPSASTGHSNASVVRSGASGPLFAAYTFSKSTSDLTLPTGLCDFRSVPVVDPVAAAPRLYPIATTADTNANVNATANANATPVTISVASAPHIVLDDSRAGSDAPPMRKLKSSLKLPSLTKLFSTSHLLPKLVRFASALEKVKMFDGRDSPAAVSLQNTPEGLPNFPDFDLSDYFSSHRNFTDLGIDDSNSDSDSDTFSEYTKARKYRISLSNFSAPKNIYDRQGSPVYLQLLALGADKELLVLCVMCQNVAFEKSVSVKLTLNNWQSTLIFNNATYVKSFTSVNYDQFRFTVPLSHLPSTVSAQFCIRYDVNGQTYWDNNSNRNYNVVLATFLQGSSFGYKAPTFAPKPIEKTPAYNYDDLISKLVLVLKSMEKLQPQVNKQVRPRYLQSFRSKSANETPVLKNTKDTKEVKEVSKDKDTSGSISIPKGKKSEVKIGRVKPASFQDSKFNSSSYATLLQTYCFNGSAASLPNGSLSNSRSNSSSSINSDFNMTSFHLFGDSIHI